MKGRFNEFGGQYVPETVMNALKELEDEFYKAIDDKEFMEEYRYYLKRLYRKTKSFYYAENMTRGFRWSKDLFKERRFKSYRSS